MNLINLVGPLVFKNRLTEMTYFTTSACNYRCEHCFIINELNKKSEDLSVDEIKAMGAHIKSMQRVHMGGGEPFIKKDMCEKGLTVSNTWNSEVVCIPTNGWHTSNIVESIENFGKLAKGNFRIHFSLNAMGKDMDDFCKRDGAFEKWKTSIMRSIEKTKHIKNVSIVGLITVGDYNQSNFKKLKDFLLEEIKVDDISFQLCRKHESYQVDPDYELFESYVDDYFQHTKKQNPFLSAYRALVRKYTVKYNRESSQITPCYAGKTRVVMAPNGDIYPCETLGYPNGKDQEKWLMGNVRDTGYNIHQLLKSKRAKEIRKTIRHSKCHCEHGIDLALNLLCNNRFKVEVVMLGMWYLLKRLWIRNGIRIQA